MDVEVGVVYAEVDVEVCMVWGAEVRWRRSYLGHRRGLCTRRSRCTTRPAADRCYTLRAHTCTLTPAGVAIETEERVNTWTHAVEWR